ncbi:MAG: LicD family protein [Bacteroidales bacterium]|nr:LicD family protein [Bacteroidales bacterium]
MQPKELTSQELRQLQLLQIDMVDELDRICRKYNIPYVLYGGTMLGAIRHKGFIPWDDDIDIAMFREDYEKFKKVSSELNPNICFFQDSDTDKEYRWGYAKLRRVGTNFVRVGQEHLKCKTGVFIDIFPLDDIPLWLPFQMIQDFYCYCLRKIAWSEVGKKNTKDFKKLWFSLLSKIPMSMVVKCQKFLHKKSSNSSPNRVTCLLFPSLGKFYFKAPLKERYGMPKQWFKEREEYDFEGRKYFGIKDYDAFLKYEYRDYMTPPPKEKRKKHYASIIELNVKPLAQDTKLHEEE